MRRTTYVLVRLASLTAATFVLVAAPLLLMYVGGLLAGLPLGRETGSFLGALVGAVLLAACLSGLAALVSALTIRRGLAVAAVIVVLLVSYTVVVDDPGDLRWTPATRRSARSPGCSRRTRWSTGCRSSSSTRRRPRRPRPPAPAWASSTSSPPRSWSLGSVGAMLARYRKVTA